MSEQISLWSIGPSVYLPSLLFGIGQGAVAPVIALSARDLGASVATASLVVAMLGVGQIVGDLPAGMLAVRVGERPAMLMATAVTAGALALCLVATSVWLLAVAIVLLGVAASVWGLARHAYLTEVVPYPLRARAMSTLGGTARIGAFIGPFLGAAVMSRLGTDGAYWVHLVAAGVAAALLLALPVPQTRSLPSPTPTSALGSTSQVIRRHLPVLRTLGMGALLVGAVRASRQAVIPLWGDHIGLDPATTSLIFGVSGAVDMLLFYPAGMAMDRLGRRWVAVPSMLVLGLAHLALPLAHGSAALTAVAVGMGLGNGMGSGIIMTLGADVSPTTSRATFLGAWRLCADLGNGAGPLVISAITAVAALAPAAIAMAGVAGVAAAAMGYWIPRHGNGA
ncbi:MFS transporter [Phytoactinopolyspora halotolerans]|uniref:MFS transporter n=1 Tax=Phytoactinopolyspora halotolerans TaxID=1981512 RepID=A0A6L9SIK1_9ACTN|nr:MFS transporter [Phytoactinopolyspora halotolerans]NEE04252.1 MFS transporter [Phytoactinopolyspora halotolerans]